MDSGYLILIQRFPGLVIRRLSVSVSHREGNFMGITHDWGNIVFPSAAVSE